MELPGVAELEPDRKSTRLNSSHLVISYAVFCLKKEALMVAHVARQQGFGRILQPFGDQGGDFAAQICGAVQFCDLEVVYSFFFKGAAVPRLLPFSPNRHSPS